MDEDSVQTEPPVGSSQMATTLAASKLDSSDAVADFIVVVPDDPRAAKGTPCHGYRQAMWQVQAWWFQWSLLDELSEYHCCRGGEGSS